MDKIEGSPHYTDAQRMHLRAVTSLAGEIIATYWPMRTFVHHNPLHALESLPFREAIALARERLGGQGYLPPETYRKFVKSGRIKPRHIESALASVACPGSPISLGDRKIIPLEVLRAHLLRGISAPASDVREALLALSPDRSQILSLARLLAAPAPSEEAGGKNRGATDPSLPWGWPFTLSSWCDKVLGTSTVESVNRVMVRWSEAFLDEGHATWPMPGREKGFYRAWRALAALEWSRKETRMTLSRLPEGPEDALLFLLESMKIPDSSHQDYLSLHLSALPGWPAFIKWRSAQEDYPYQQSYPADLLQFLAVRLFYEQIEIVAACREGPGIDGTYEAIREEEARRATGLHGENTQGKAQKIGNAFRLASLFKELEVSAADLQKADPEDLRTLLSWLDAFPESEHGPVWLEAFEAGYQDGLLKTLAASPALKGAVEAAWHEGGSFSPPHPDSLVRPQAQAVFCIDVRSEPFRRHLESVGDYETFGFAGFFSVFVRFRALESDHETDQFPVIMKPRNTVREVLRSYHGGLHHRRQSGLRILRAGHSLLHDLKENVVTPYVAVESLGWFYGFPLVGKTLFPIQQNRFTSFLRRLLMPTVSTTLTVDKLSRPEVEEMLASEQRSVIRRALKEHFGDRNLNLSLERLEFLRKRAMEMIPPEEARKGPRPHPAALTLKEEDAFVLTLRERYRITHGWAFARLERMTRIGLTLNEQVQTVDTALRMMGMTTNFARLVLFCGHGSTSENNPFESALDCGACGGNRGKPNARILAAMANKAPVRKKLSENGIEIPEDTYFIAGEHNTATDEVSFFDLEDIPYTHRSDLVRLSEDLREAGVRTSRERCSRFPEIRGPLTPAGALREVKGRSTDWSQVRPEWGLSGNASFIIGRRAHTRKVDLGGRAFLHSYDFREDPKGLLLEGIMTGPQVVGEWINMEHYFSTVDNAVFGSGSKIYHNVVGRLGIMAGPQSDLLTGLAWQTVIDRTRPFHEPMRLLAVIEAPTDRIAAIIRRHTVLQHFYDNAWVHLVALSPDGTLNIYLPGGGWIPKDPGALSSTTFEKEPTS